MIAVHARADTFVRDEAPFANEGGSAHLRLLGVGNNRPIVYFSQADIDATLSGAWPSSAKLRLYAGATLGQFPAWGLYVNVHRMAMDWTEGNGWRTELPSGGSPTGSGGGATNSCSSDDDISNESPECSTPWSMGWGWPPAYQSYATDGRTILSGDTWVEWDVRQDVQQFTYGVQNKGWLLKINGEGSPEGLLFVSRSSPDWRRPELELEYYPTFGGFYSDPPLISIQSAFTVDEGEALLTSGTFQDWDSGAWTLLQRYDDGTQDQSSPVTPPSFDFAHTYANDGAYEATVRITDSAGAWGRVDLHVTVNNVLPAVSAGPDADVALSSPFTRDGSFSDPGDDPWTATVDYDDGAGFEPLTLAPDKTFALEHTYTTNGAKHVRVRVCDDDDCATDEVLVTVTGVAAAFDVLRASDEEGHPVLFRDRSQPADGSLTYSWTFGNGQGSSTILNPVWVYAQSATYTVCLVVTGPSGQSDADCQDLSVTDSAPVASFSIRSGLPPREGTVLQFDDASLEGQDAIVDWFWDFGDGTPTTNQPNPTHAFATDGGPTVCHKVKDADGSWSPLACKDLIVENVAPSPTIVGPSSTQPGVPITLLGSATDPGGEPTSFAWDLDGDGVYETSGDTANFTSSNSATFTVRLRATDDDGASGVVSKAIVVGHGNAPIARAGGPYLIGEGSAVRLDGSGSEDPGGSISAWAWDLNGDQVFEASGRVQITTPVADDHVETVRLRVTDWQGYTAEDSATITVVNVDPIVRIAQSAALAEEGRTTSLVAWVIDPGRLDAFSGTVTWGDGSSQPIVPPAAGLPFLLEHTYVDERTGSFSVTIEVSDDDQGDGSASTAITVANLPPFVQAGDDITATEGVPFTQTGFVMDLGATDTIASMSADFGDGSAPVALYPDSEGLFTFGHTYGEAGIRLLTVSATDNDGGIGRHSLLVVVRPSSSPSPEPGVPSWPLGSVLTVTDASATSLAISWSAAGDPAGAVVKYAVSLDGVPVGYAEPGERSFTFPNLPPDSEHVFEVRAGDADGQWSEPGRLAGRARTRMQVVPFNPAAIDGTVVTTMSSALRFLHEGPNAVQVGADPDAFAPERAAGIRGHVVERDATSPSGDRPVSGARVSIVGHPELGAAGTRAAGEIDLAVNGGASVVVRVTCTGYLPVDRTVNVGWGEWVDIGRIVLTKLDAEATGIDLSPTSAAQWALGSVSPADDRPARRATVLLQPGTQAYAVFPSGGETALDRVTLRATEYTRGEAGLDAMPGSLPKTSAYTYAVDVTADEALALGAEHVRFQPEAVLYVDNFIGFDVGDAAPVGTYERGRSVWEPGPDGRVIFVRTDPNGDVSVDIDGDQNMPPTEGEAIGITPSEREALAQLYPANSYPFGTSLWRVVADHFSTKDVNWTASGLPGNPEPNGGKPNTSQAPDNQNVQCGSIIGAEARTLGEAVGIAGTPFALHYQTDRSADFLANDRVEVPLGDLPAEVEWVHVEMIVAGRQLDHRYSRAEAAAQRVHVFHASNGWDGRDAYGRRLLGSQPARIRVGYQYPRAYASASAGATPVRTFGRTYFLSSIGAGGGSGAVLRMLSAQAVVVWSEWETSVGQWTNAGLGLGGFSLSDHHAYDIRSQRLYLGDGTTRGADALGAIVTHVAGGPEGADSAGDGGPAAKAVLHAPQTLAVGPDGSVYVSENGPRSQRVRKIDPDGTIHTIAGQLGPCTGDCGDEGWAVNALLSGPSGLAVAPDGTVYIAEAQGHRIRQITPDGKIHRFAGTGQEGYSPADEGIDARDAKLSSPQGVAVGPDGSVYIADSFNARVRQVTPDGRIGTIAGNGGVASCTWNEFGSGSLMQARDAPISAYGVVVGPDGDVYVSGNKCVTKLRSDGALRLLAGSPNPGFGGDEGVAWQAQIALDSGTAVGGIATGRTGGYIADAGNNRIRRVSMDGIIHTIAGNGVTGASASGRPALATSLLSPHAVAEGPDGSVYFLEQIGQVGQIRRIRPQGPSLSLAERVVPSADGASLYVFDEEGRHQRTVDALTNALRYQFSYTNGLLTDIVDGTGTNHTTIARSASGDQVTITAPFGQVTVLGISGGKVATITDPLGHAHTFTYHPAGTNGAGLLASMTNPRGYTSSFTYDARGRLIADQGPAADNPKTLAQAPITTADGKSYRVTFQSPLDRSTLYDVRYDYDDDPNNGVDPLVLERRIVTGPDGTTSESRSFPDGREDARLFSDPERTHLEMTATAKRGPDPRFEMQAPVTTESTLTIPGVSGPVGSFPQLTVLAGSSREVTLSDPDDPMSVERVVEATTVNTATYEREYDAQARTLTVRSPEGRTVTVTFDALGRPSRVARGTTLDPPPVLRAPIDFTYDARGRLETVRHAGNRQTFGYEPSGYGYVTSITNPMGETVTLVPRADGRLESLTTGGETVTFAHDDNGNMDSIAPPERPAHTFAFTAADQPRLYTPPTVNGEDHSISTTYNDDAQPDHVTTPDDDIDYGYNAASGNLETIDDGTITTLTYDPTTKKLAGVSRPGRVSVSYDYQGPLVVGTTWSSANVSGSVVRTYNNDLRVQSLAILGRPAIQYGYDGDGLVTSAGPLTLVRDPVDGAVTEAHLDNRTQAWNRGWDGRLEAILMTGVHSFEYRHDPLGRITRITESTNQGYLAHKYRYDEAGQLVEVQEKSWTTPFESGQWELVAEYRYDVNGNRLYEITPTGFAEATYDAQDRLRTYTKNGVIGTYLYSGRGSLRQVLRSPSAPGDNGTIYEYDNFGNLTSVQGPNLQIDYLLDATNRRVGKRRNGQLERTWIYQDALEPVFERDLVHNTETQFVYAAHAHVPSYMIRNGERFFFYTDHLGSVRKVISQYGYVAQEIEYDAWGNVLPRSTNIDFQPFAFAGGLYDPDTQLTRFGARDFDACVGRWTARDPILFGGAQSNLYAYSGNDPVNRVDPDGLLPMGAVPDNVIYNAQQVVQAISGDDFNEKDLNLLTEVVIGEISPAPWEMAKALSFANVEPTNPTTLTEGQAAFIEDIFARLKEKLEEGITDAKEDDPKLRSAESKKLLRTQALVARAEKLYRLARSSGRCKIKK